MNKLIYILGVVLLVSLFSVSASNIATVNESFTIWGDVIADNQYYSVDYALLTVEGFFVDENMSFVSTGIYNYNYTFTEKGEYFINIDFYKNSSVVGKATGSISVIDKIGVGEMIAENYLFLIIVAMLSFLAFYLKNWVLLIATGLLFMLMPFIYSFNLTGISQASLIIMFILIGLSVMYQGIYSLSDERKPRK